MHGRRQLLVGASAGAALLLAPNPAHARRAKRPNFWVKVHANHPLQASLADEVDAPATAVVRALRGVEQWASWVPMFAQSDLVSREGSRATFDAELDLPWPVRDRSFRADAQDQGSLGLSLQRVPGVGNMGDFNAMLSVSDLGDGRAQLSVDVEVDFGLRLTKGFIEWLARIKAPQMFTALEARAQAGG